MKQLIFKIPKNFMNCAITIDGNFICDTNDSKNWDTIKIPLPNKYQWVISSQYLDGTINLRGHKL